MVVLWVSIRRNLLAVPILFVPSRFQNWVPLSGNVGLHSDRIYVFAAFIVIDGRPTNHINLEVEHAFL